MFIFYGCDFENLLPDLRCLDRLFVPFAGLAHLHSLSPRLVHKDFKTANVLVDENFIAKVADAGLRNFLGRIDIAGPSSQVTADEIFLAPEYSLFTL